MGLLKGLPADYVLNTKQYGKVTIHATPRDVNVPAAGELAGKRVANSKTPTQGQLGVIQATLRENASDVNVRETRLLFNLGYNTGGNVAIEIPGYSLTNPRNQKDLANALGESIWNGTIKVADPEEKSDLAFVLNSYLTVGQVNPWIMIDGIYNEPDEPKVVFPAKAYWRDPQAEMPGGE